MTAVAPALDPLIAEAKFRMRRRRVLLALVALLAAAGVMIAGLRPDAASAPRVTSQGANRNGLARIYVPANTPRRKCRRGEMGCVVLDSHGASKWNVRPIERTLASVASKTSVRVVQIRYIPSRSAVEAVIAPGEWHRVERFAGLLAHDNPFFSVVYGTDAPPLPRPSTAGKGWITCSRGVPVHWNKRSVCVT